MAMAIVGASFGVVQGQTKAVVYEYSIVTTHEGRHNWLIYPNAKGQFEKTPLEKILSLAPYLKEEKLFENNQIITSKLNEMCANGYELYNISILPFNYYEITTRYYLRKPKE